MTGSLNQFRPIPLIRTSERSAFKRCPAAWNWGWNLGLETRMPRQDARWFGTCWHLVWAEMYTPPEGKDGFTRADKDPHEIWDALTHDAYVKMTTYPYWGEDAEKEFVDAQKLGHIMIDGQISQWNMDPAWEVIMPEQRFKVNIPFNHRQQALPLGFWTTIGYPRGANAGGYIAQGIGTFDITVFDHSSGYPEPKVVDWKTIGKKYSDKSNNKDDQLGTYISVATQFLRAKGIITKDQEIREFIFSFARKAKPPENCDERGRVRNKPKKEHYVKAINENTFGLVNDKWTLPELEAVSVNLGLTVYGDVSKNQGSPLFWREPVHRNKHNRLRQVERIADDVQTIAQVRAGVSPVLKSPGEHCNWCDFNELCDIDEDGGDTENFIKDMYKVRDPYADHREGARNSKESVIAKKETGVT